MKQRDLEEFRSQLRHARDRSGLDGIFRVDISQSLLVLYHYLPNRDSDNLSPPLLYSHSQLVHQLTLKYIALILLLYLISPRRLVIRPRLKTVRLDS